MMNNYELIDNVVALEMATLRLVTTNVLLNVCEAPQVAYFSLRLISETCHTIRQLYEEDANICELKRKPEDLVLDIISKASDAVETASE